MNSYKKLAANVGFSFKNVSLLETALTHRSFLNEHREIESSNERLEFLGDAVLELIVSFFLYKKYPGKSEGQLTLWRSKIVQTKTLAAIARKLQLPLYLKLSKGEQENNGQNNNSLLADTLEAVIGAIFIDQGIKSAEKFIHQILLDTLEQIIQNEEVADYKSLYQEKVQASGQATPFYKIISSTGPDHDKLFVSAVYVDGVEIALGNGKSKQIAEQQAAKLALEKFFKKE